ncbi:MAG: Rare lipoprotein A precursor [uncultured Campylobacterales bacterium]|uniref:Probable endolytic peptidoglycan transglycosylase RlpA n=1 Tax=uncultured Campylobacterales bacterium TaxID=352960 RepID=A0A6S6SNL3_9BACT|nr:MAG: Rare lipoprotein A precursor [uncultured Campylobacterales bacterium]
MSYLIRSIFILIFFFGCVSTSKVLIPKDIKDSPNMHKATLKAYNINSIIYVPKIPTVGYSEAGIASWYGDKFHGKYTSNGEVYNMYGLTAAHKTLPMNTIVQVTNLKNHKSIVLRINDRGPFIHKRIIDLSYEAAKTLEFAKHGTTNVKIKVLQLSNNLPKRTTTVMPKETVTPKAANSKTDNGLLLQVGAFSKFERAVKVKQSYSYFDKPVLIKKIKQNNKIYYKVVIGYFNSKEEIKRFISRNPKFKNSIIFKG